jgi:hypothetical protein
MAYLYAHRLWVVVLVPGGIFLYRWLDQPPPLSAEPAIWFWLKPAFLTLVSLFLLVMVSWIIAGFLVREDQLPPGR